MVINRLCRWQTAQVQFVQIAGGPPLSTAQPHLRAQLDMDINTAPGQIVPSAKVEAVLSELQILQPRSLKVEMRHERDATDLSVASLDRIIDKGWRL